MFTAAEQVCDVDTTNTSMRTSDVTSDGAVIVVQCGNQPRQYVEVVFTGVSVPSLSGLPLRVARKRLALVGLSVDVISRPAKDDASVGDVMRQQPGEGAVVPNGSIVEVWEASM
jgi:beta-lactam-binding protein with PASTA domain